MISPELLRRYQFFAGFSHKQLDEIAMAADNVSFDAEHWFFTEGDALTKFFLILEGSVALTHNIPDQNVTQTTTMQLTGNYVIEALVIGMLVEQDVFGWSALIPPNESTAGAQAMTECNVIIFDTIKLRSTLQDNCGFSHLLTLKAAQIIRDRLRMRRIELIGDYLQEPNPLV